MEIQGSSPPASRADAGATAGVGDDFMADGWVLFAGLMLLFAGIWNVFEGFFALFRSAYFVGHAVYGDLWIWASLWILFGLLELGAGGAVMAGRAWGRWFGIIVVGLNTLVTMASLATYPFWSLVSLAVQFAILYGLTARWRRASTAV